MEESPVVIEPAVLCGFKVIKYIQDIVASWQFVFQGCHVTEMPEISVLFAHVAKLLRALVLAVAYNVCPSHLATSLHLADAFLFSVFLGLRQPEMVIEALLTSKVPVTFAAGDSNPCGLAGRRCHTVTTRLIADMRLAPPRPLITCFANEPLCHRFCKTVYHMVMSLRCHTVNLYV